MEPEPAPPELAQAPLVLPLSFATQLVQQALVLSQLRGASPSATRSTTLRFASADTASLARILSGRGADQVLTLVIPTGRGQADCEGAGHICS